MLLWINNIGWIQTREHCEKNKNDKVRRQVNQQKMQLLPELEEGRWNKKREQTITHNIKNQSTAFSYWQEFCN